MNWHSIYFSAVFAGGLRLCLAVVLSSNIVRMAFYLVLVAGGHGGFVFSGRGRFYRRDAAVDLCRRHVGAVDFRRDAHGAKPVHFDEDAGGDWILAAIVGGALLAVLMQAAFSVPQWRVGAANSDEATLAAPTTTVVGESLLGVRVDSMTKRVESAAGRIAVGLFVAV